MRTDTAGGGRHTEGRRALQRAVGRDREIESGILGVEREREWVEGTVGGKEIIIIIIIIMLLVMLKYDLKHHVTL